MTTDSQKPNATELLGFQDIVFGNPNWVNAVAAIAAVLALFTLLSYRRCAMPVGLRCAAISLRVLGIALLLVCLLEPLGSMQRPKSQANIFAVLVDNSQSMGILMQEALRSGRPELEESLGDESVWQRKLSDDFRLRRYLFDSAMAPVDTFAGRKAIGNETALFQALQSLHDRYQG